MVIFNDQTLLNELKKVKKGLSHLIQQIRELIHLIKERCKVYSKALYKLNVIIFKRRNSSKSYKDL